MPEPGLLNNLLLLLLVLAAGVVAARKLSPLIRQHMKGEGGWGRLAERFTTVSRAKDSVRRRQTVQVGRVVYRNCVGVGIGDAGLYLEMGSTLPLLGKPPLLIPWSQVGGVEEVRLHWRKAVMLSIGKPVLATVTIDADLAQSLRPWLPASGARGMA